MKITNVKINEKFEQIILYEIIQNNKLFYFGKIDVNIIKDLFTVSPAQYTISTIKAFDYGDEKEIKEHLEKLKNEQMEGYQRLKENETKVNEIAEYIGSTENFNIIPNSIIFSIKSSLITEEDLVKMIQDDEIPDTFQIIESDDYSLLFIPKKMIENPKLKPLWIVDGHHRLLGLKKFINDGYNNELPILATFILNKDKVDEAEIFKTVNYKIKPVNKSFYYQIMGEFGIGEKEFIFLHYFTRLVNETEKSPLLGRIKMLGRVDKGSSISQTISQSFFVEELYYCLFVRKKLFISYFSNEKVARIPMLRYFIINDNDALASKVIIKYFIIIRKYFNEKYGKNKWKEFSKDNEYNKLLKSTGIGALIELFPYVYLSFLNENNLLTCLDKQLKFNFEAHHFGSIIKPLFDDFDILKLIEGKYSVGSSQSLLKKLANDLWKRIAEKSKINIVEIGNKYIGWYNKEVFEIE